MKKFALCLLIAALPALSFAQGFSIKGKIGPQAAQARAYLLYQAGDKNMSDSVAITAGEFIFKGSVTSPANAVLVIDPQGKGLKLLPGQADALYFYIENADMTVTSPDSLAKATISGSKVNTDNQRLKDALKPVADKMKALMDEYKHASDAQQINPEFKSSIQQRYAAIQAEQQTLSRQFIKNNPQSYISLIAMSALKLSQDDPTETEQIFNSLSAEVRNTDNGKATQKVIDGMKALSIGALAPDFTQTDTAGKAVTLSSFRGKYVLIDFWASWCGPCRAENPNVVKAYARFKNKYFAIFGVSLDKSTGRDAWLTAIRNDGLTWTQVSDLRYWANEAALLYKVNSIPQNFLLDPSGKIIAKGLRGDDLETKLAQIFKM